MTEGKADRKLYVFSVQFILVVHHYCKNLPMPIFSTRNPCYWECCSLIPSKCPAVFAHIAASCSLVHFSDLEILVWRMLMSCLTFYFPPPMESSFEKHVLKENQILGYLSYKRG